MVVHNGGPFLRPAVESVLASNLVPVELVLIDNASTDGAVAALPTDARLRLVGWGENDGIPAGTNEGVRRATAPFLAIMDQDDWTHPERLARQVEWLNEHPSYGGIACRTTLIDAADRRIGGDFTLHRPAEHRAFTRFSQAACFGSHLWRRENVARFPRQVLFPFSSDFDFVARVNEQTEVGALPQELFSYRIHAAQTTKRRRHEQMAAECAIRLLTAVRRAGRAEPWDAVRSWLPEAVRQPDAAGIYRAALALCRAQGETLLAAYHARRLLARSRNRKDWAAALDALRWAIQTGPGRREVVALAARGPLRALGLRPWPAE